MTNATTTTSSRWTDDSPSVWRGHYVMMRRSGVTDQKLAGPYRDVTRAWDALHREIRRLRQQGRDAQWDRGDGGHVYVTTWLDDAPWGRGARGLKRVFEMEPLPPEWA